MRNTLQHLEKNFVFKTGVCAGRCKRLLQGIESRDAEIIRLSELVTFLEIQLEDELQDYNATSAIRDDHDTS